jgi:hypothetical protein
MVHLFSGLILSVSLKLFLDEIKILISIVATRGWRRKMGREKGDAAQRVQYFGEAEGINFFDLLYTMVQPNLATHTFFMLSPENSISE